MSLKKLMKLTFKLILAAVALMWGAQSNSAATPSPAYAEYLSKRSTELLETTLAMVPTTTVVHYTDNLQTAINAASLGDTLVLDVKSKGTFTGVFTLPVKASCNGSAFVTIESEEIGSLPAGVRVSPAVVAHMAKIETNSGAGVGPITAAAGAGCYRLRGLEITNNTTARVNNMITLSGGSYYIFDRNFVHPKEYPNTTPPYNTTAHFAIILTQSSHDQVTNSDIDGFYGLDPGNTIGQAASDTVGVSIEAGPSDDNLIDNNHFNVWYNGMFIGGADSTQTATATISGSPTVTQATLSNVTGLNVGDVIAIQIPYVSSNCKVQNPLANCYGNGVVTAIAGTTVTYTALIGTSAAGAARITIPGGTVPSGIAVWRNGRITNTVVTRNAFEINYAFGLWQAQNNGNHPKGYIEIKNADGLLINGNKFFGFWAVIGIGAANQSGGDPYATIANTTISNNWLHYFYTPMKATMVDPYYISTNGSNLTYSNNLFTKMLNNEISSIEVQILEGQNGYNITANHNTIMTGYPAIYSKRFGTWEEQISNNPGASTFTIQNNLAGWGNYGWGCSTGAFSTCISQTEDQNYFVLNQNPPSEDPADHFPNSLQGATWAAAKMVNAAACDAGTDINGCRLASDSSGRNAATDGSDIGVNINALLAACPDCATGTTTTAAPAVRGLLRVRGRLPVRH